MPGPYLTPGVYIEEIPSGSKPIQGVGTSVAAFLGFTEKRPAGNTGQPLFISSWTDYEEKFGGFVADFFTPFSVYGYFLNGGSSCYVQSLATQADAEGARQSGPSSVGLLTAGGARALELRSRAEGAAAQSISVEIGDASGEGLSEDQFKLTVKVNGQVIDELNNLTMEKQPQGGAKYVLAALQRNKTLVASDLDLAGSAIERRPRNGVYALTTALVAPLASAKTFEGNATTRTGLGALEEIADVTMVVCPDVMTMYMHSKRTPEDLEAVAAVQNAILAHCATMKDRFAIIDSPPDMSVQEVYDWRMSGANFSKDDGKYGAFYYPWIYIANPLARNGDKSIKLPPSGHIAGLYARVDTERGVHKAPANETLRGAIKLEKQIIDSEQAKLNPYGVNCIRAFPGRGILIWGARTLAEAASEWRYINVRRLFNYIEESIYEGTQWVVFEPNDMDLWERVKRTITAFLTNVWRDGALFGATPGEAFYVKCDADLNPPSRRDNGELIVEVGIAPVKPAEFVIFRFKQMSGGGEINE